MPTSTTETDNVLELRKLFPHVGQIYLAESSECGTASYLLAPKSPSGEALIRVDVVEVFATRLDEVDDPFIPLDSTGCESKRLWIDRGRWVSHWVAFVLKDRSSARYFPYEPLVAAYKRWESTWMMVFGADGVGASGLQVPCEVVRSAVRAEEELMGWE